MIDDKNRAEILNAYQKSTRSIQDIARIYRVPVDEVLHIIGQDDLTSVTFQGDLIDPSEAGPGVTPNYEGKTEHVIFTTD